VTALKKWRECKENGCEEKCIAKGYCQRHYRSRRLDGRLSTNSDLERNKVIKQRLALRRELPADLKDAYDF